MKEELAATSTMSIAMVGTSESMVRRMLLEKARETLERTKSTFEALDWVLVLER